MNRRPPEGAKGRPEVLKFVVDYGNTFLYTFYRPFRVLFLEVSL